MFRLTPFPSIFVAFVNHFRKYVDNTQGTFFYQKKLQVWNSKTFQFLLNFHDFRSEDQKRLFSKRNKKLSVLNKVPQVHRVPKRLSAWVSECLSAQVTFEWPSAQVPECQSAQVSYVPECPSAFREPECLKCLSALRVLFECLSNALWVLFE